MNKKDILKQLKNIKPKYEQEGLIILGLFGSYSQDKQTQYSDIDIAYKIDYDKFSQKYIDGFSKLLRIDDIQKELQETFKKNIDLVPNTNTNIIKDLVYV